MLRIVYWVTSNSKIVDNFSIIATFSDPVRRGGFFGTFHSVVSGTFHSAAGGFFRPS